MESEAQEKQIAVLHTHSPGGELQGRRSQTLRDNLIAYPVLEGLVFKKSISNNKFVGYYQSHVRFLDAPCDISQRLSVETLEAFYTSSKPLLSDMPYGLMFSLTFVDA